MPTTPRPLARLCAIAALATGLAGNPALAAEPAQSSLLETLGKLLQPRQDAPDASAESATPGQTEPTRALPVARNERRVALVVGNADYRQGALANPVNDARAMAARLRDLGFDVVLRENLQTRDIGGAYREFRNKIAPGSVALVFYAGHGVQIKGQNYFPAVDSVIASEEDVPLQSLNLGTLLDNMEEAKAGVSLVFLDACRDNPFARRFRGATRGLAKVEAASGTLIHYATRPGSVAEDGHGQNGTYTAALLAQIGEPDVPVEQVLKRVTNRVVAQTKGKQEPWVEGSLRGDFYFIFQGPTTIQPPSAAADPDPETATWAAADRAASTAGYRAYLDAYPQGRYAVAAKIKLDALQTPAAAPAKPAAAVPPAPTFPPPAATAPDDPETALWNEVKTSGAREYLDAYLKQYPKGKYAALAKVDMKKIDERDAAEKKAAAERARQTALQADQHAWEQAKTDNTPAAYAAYLETHPQGRYATLAAAARQKRTAEAAQQAEAELWRQAETAGISTAMQAYLDRYPAGQQAAAARLKLAALKKEEADRRPGKAFKDCADCPELVVIPAGSVEMGSNDADSDEKPVHTVSVRAFALGNTEVTQGQWKSVMGSNPSHFSQCGDDCPVENVSWDDAQAYFKKLNEKTGKRYRLPSEAEWEYAARAGTRTAYYTGDCIHTNQANYDGNSDYNNCGAKTGVYRKQTVKVGSFAPNRFGLYDMVGNVREWVEDCYHDSYQGAPTDGSVWASGCTEDRRVLRGGSWISSPRLARSALRARDSREYRDNYNGFRLARTLP